MIRQTPIGICIIKESFESSALHNKKQACLLIDMLISQIQTQIYEVLGL